MALARSVFSAITAAMCFASVVGAQGTGSVRGRVVDSTNSQGLPNVSVLVEGTQLGTLTRSDGSFDLGGVTAGSHVIRARRIGYAARTVTVNVTAGGSTTADIKLTPQSTVLTEVVVTGYGTQRREAITGSVASLDAAQADKGVITNATQLVQGRVSGVEIIQNSGEPGAGSQIRIRGGTSISASNDPLYVVDGVPLQNEQTVAGAAGIGSINPALARNPLNSINPDDIESISILKDASATAIYGSRGANGVILIQTKRGAGGVSEMEYETYVGAASPAKTLGLLNGDEYRAFVKANVAKLGQSAVDALGPANTDWEKELTRTALATNHNLAFSGGSTQTHYRASLNYFDEEGVVKANGLRRYQGRLNAAHYAWNQKLRLGLNIMASRVNNTFSPSENTGGFLGGLFTNMVIYNPTFPVRRADGAYYEMGCPPNVQTCVPSAQDVRNPVAMAEQLMDRAPETRVLGNVNATVQIFDDLSAQTTLGADNTNSDRQTFAPRSSAVGAAYGGYARQAERSLQNTNFQQLLTYTPRFGVNHEFEIVGGYEYTKNDVQGFEAQMQGFITDAFGVDNLGAGTQASSPVPISYHDESQLVSFFSRANYGYAHKYYLTGVLRRDGSSRLAPGHQWEVFPAISGSWRLSEESFMRDMLPSSMSNLSIRLGWGKQGNQAVQPYQTQLLLRADPGASYPFGGTIVNGLRAAQVGNPDLKWETAAQTNLGIDYGFLNDRITGSLEFYQKDTKDLLLDVAVPQPAVVSTRIENVGSLRNRGIEASMDGQLYRSGKTTLSGGLTFTAERNKVTNIGGVKFINTGGVSGQGQSNQYSQRIMVGEPIGTFFGPKFLFVNAQGQQVFACKTGSPDCSNGQTTNPSDEDKVVLGSANPNFTVGLRNNLNWHNFDASWLWRGEYGGKVFNNTALVYASKSDATQGRNFLKSALSMPDAIGEPAKFSSRWVEDRTFTRLQNLTVGYLVPTQYTAGRQTRVYVSGDNLLLITNYTGYDPEVYVASGLASRGIDYLVYPPSRRFTLGARVQF
ncbi:MAG TPA: TonB-dependent receptor [Gemmatimonadaceae bacterium]|jgi:TonB-dependent starch-binding outer membrane protein SusC|nr:TonB-dependent receptor [Gemmatimonadaceae bacterium]